MNYNQERILLAKKLVAYSNQRLYLSSNVLASIHFVYMQ